MNENKSFGFDAIAPISQILPFVSSESGIQVFDMPEVRFIGKSTKDKLNSDPNPIPAFWVEYFAKGYNLVTDVLRMQFQTDTGLLF